MIWLPSPRSVLALLLLLGLSACDRTLPYYECDDPCVECEEPCKCPDGECVPVPPIGWEGPVLLWVGPGAEAQPCPDRAINIVYEGHADLHATGNCPPCECGPPACELPVGVIASSADVCPDDSGVLTAFDAPAGWDGGCVTPGTILDSAYASVTISSTTVRSCEPMAGPPVPAQGAIEWEVFARACKSADPLVACNDPSKYCAPTSAPPPPGFSQCVAKGGEHPQCPVGYPDRRVFFAGISGELGCTDCLCGPPEGSDCSAVLTGYSDAACTNAVFIGDVSLEVSACVDAIVSGDLVSMSATVLSDSPGACVPFGGQSFGQIAPIEPSTFCCQLPVD